MQITINISISPTADNPFEVKVDPGHEGENVKVLVEKKKPKALTIYVRTITGKLIELIITSEDTIDMVKTRIQGKEGIPPEQQLLRYGGIALKDKQTVAQLNMPDNALVDLILNLRGS